MISEADKLECVRREIAMRRRVYYNRVRSGLMTQAHADREIAIMEAIEADYAKLVEPRFV